MAANDVLAQPRCYLKGFLGPQHQALGVVAGCYRLRCFNRLLVFPVLVDTVQRHVDRCLLRLVVFKVTKPVPYNRLREALFVDYFVTLELSFLGGFTHVVVLSSHRCW